MTDKAVSWQPAAPSLSQDGSQEEPPLAGIRIPGIPTTVFWPARSQGLIRIRSVLPLDRRRHLEVPVELRFKREQLSPALTLLADDPEVFLADWASAIAVTLLYYGRAHSQEEFIGMPSREESRFRWRTQVLKGGIPGIPYTVTVDRILIRDLHTFVTGPKTWLYLVFLIRRNLLPPGLIEWALKGRPRGEHAKSPLLLPYARMALHMANQLIDEAETDSKLDAQLTDILREDRHGRGYITGCRSVAEYLERTGTRGRHRLAVLLVDRTLRSAWEPFHLTAPRRCDPEYVFKKWLRPEYRERCEAEARRWNEGALVKLWYGRLLGPENQTAHDFDLLA